MIDPLRLHFRVACGADHAFATWTRRVSLWWPADHTVSQGPDVQVTFESRVGGRIFERTPAGEGHEWGWITAWEPPARLAYKWHLGGASRQATDVEVTFAEGADGTTDVVIEHGGWDALGSDAEERRQRNQAGWGGIVSLFVAACVLQSTIARSGPHAQR